MLSHIQLFAIPWTVACQAPLSMGFSRKEYRSQLAFPPPEDLPNQTLVSCVSCIGWQILYHSATWKAQPISYLLHLFWNTKYLSYH